MRRSGNRRPLPRPNENRLTRYKHADSFETPRFSDMRTFMRRRPCVRARDRDAGDRGLRESQEFVRGLAGLEIVGCDVVEVYPAYDHAQITALLAASARVSQPALQENGVDVNNRSTISLGGIAREPTGSILE
jgi:Arginase family